jgi:hypothetical protein
MEPDSGASSFASNVSSLSLIVMAGLVTANHVVPLVRCFRRSCRRSHVDGRNKSGHDENGTGVLTG